MAVNTDAVDNIPEDEVKLMENSVQEAISTNLQRIPLDQGAILQHLITIQLFQQRHRIISKFVNGLFGNLEIGYGRFQFKAKGLAAIMVGGDLVCSLYKAVTIKPEILQAVLKAFDSQPDRIVTGLFNRSLCVEVLVKNKEAAASLFHYYLSDELLRRLKENVSKVLNENDTITFESVELMEVERIQVREVFDELKKEAEERIKKIHNVESGNQMLCSFFENVKSYDSSSVMVTQEVTLSEDNIMEETSCNQEATGHVDNGSCFVMYKSESGPNEYIQQFGIEAAMRNVGFDKTSLFSYSNDQEELEAIQKIHDAVLSQVLKLKRKIDLSRPCINTAVEQLPQDTFRGFAPVAETSFACKPSHLFNAAKIFTHYDNKGLIGFGSFGAVRVCKTDELQKCVVKCCKFTGTIQQVERRMNSIIVETEFLQKLQHKNVMKVYGITMWSNSLGILLEYLSCGNLDSVLRNKKVTELPWPLRLRIATELSEALCFVHNYKPNKAMVHGDVKPENIFLTDDLTVKLANFGSVCIPPSFFITIDLLKTKQLKPYYIAPEYLENCAMKLGPEMDLYSYGMVLYELLTRMKIFANTTLQQSVILQLIINCELRPDMRPLVGSRVTLIPSDLEIFCLLEKLMKECWAQNPCDRPEIETVMESTLAVLNKISKQTVDQLAGKVSMKLNMKQVELREECLTSLDQFSFPFETISAPIRPFVACFSRLDEK